MNQSIHNNRSSPVQVVAAVIHDEVGNILIAQRQDEKQLWEFPGGKVENRETKVEALYRELEEELGIKSIAVSFLLDAYSYSYPNKTVDLSFYKCTLASSSCLKKHVHLKLKWVKPEDLFDYKFLSGNRKVINSLYDQSQKI